MGLVLGPAGVMGRHVNAQNGASETETHSEDTLLLIAA